MSCCAARAARAEQDHPCSLNVKGVGVRRAVCRRFPRSGSAARWEAVLPHAVRRACSTCRIMHCSGALDLGGPTVTPARQSERPTSGRPYRSGAWGGGVPFVVCYHKGLRHLGIQRNALRPTAVETKHRSFWAHGGREVKLARHTCTCKPIYLYINTSTPMAVLN